MKRLLFLLLCCGLLQGHDHRLSTGPLCQYVNSLWTNDTRQGGDVGGFIIGYDHTPLNWIYFGADFIYDEGNLRGSAGIDRSWDYLLEGRLGYTFAFGCFPYYTVTPFIGYGFYEFDQQINSINSTFRSHFQYVPIGMRFEYPVACNALIGVNAYAASTFSGFWKVDHEHGFAPTKPLWSVEIPLTYLFEYWGSVMDITVVPFFRAWALKDNGTLIGQQNYYWGGRLEIGYRFY